MNKSHSKDILLSVIVPCYNEAENLFAFSENISPCLDNIVGADNWQFVFVSNGCKDQTPQVIESIKLARHNTRCIYLKMPNYGNALRTGLKLAEEGIWALIINVDFWHKDFISWAWEKRNRYDLIIGSKRADPYLDQRPKYRKFLTWGLNVLLQLYFGAVPTDTHGQKLLCMKSMRPVLNGCVMSRGQFDTEFVLKSQKKGLKIAEVPVSIIESRKQRNLMLKKIAQNVFDIFRLKKVMKRVPQVRPIYYHRYSTSDVYECKETDVRNTSEY